MNCPPFRLSGPTTNAPPPSLLGPGLLLTLLIKLTLSPVKPAAAYSPPPAPPVTTVLFWKRLLLASILASAYTPPPEPLVAVLLLTVTLLRVRAELARIPPPSAAELRATVRFWSRGLAVALR